MSHDGACFRLLPHDKPAYVTVLPVTTVAGWHSQAAAFTTAKGLDVIGAVEKLTA